MQIPDNILNKSIWIITVAGWGSINYLGTEEEAEEYRCHKANWEQAVAKKVLFQASIGELIVEDGSGSNTLRTYLDNINKL